METKDWAVEHNKKMLEILKKSDNIMMILGASNKNTFHSPEDKDRWENYTPPEFKIESKDITRVTVTNQADIDPNNKKLLTIIFDFNEQAFYDFLKELKDKIILFIYDYSTTKFAKPISGSNLKIIYDAIKNGGFFVVNIDRSVTSYSKKETNIDMYSRYFQEINDLKGNFIFRFHREIGLKDVVDFSDANIRALKDQFDIILLSITMRDKMLLEKVGFKVTTFYNNEGYPIPPYKKREIEPLRYFIAQKGMVGGTRYRIKYETD